MTRLINSIENMEQYFDLLKYTKEKNGNIPETILKDFKKAIYSTTYGMRLKSLVILKEEFPEYYTYFIE